LASPGRSHPRSTKLRWGASCSRQRATIRRRVIAVAELGAYPYRAAPSRTARVRVRRRICDRARARPSPRSSSLHASFVIAVWNRRSTDWMRLTPIAPLLSVGVVFVEYDFALRNRHSARSRSRHNRGHSTKSIQGADCSIDLAHRRRSVCVSAREGALS